jgi:hypothetical protein
LTAGGGAWAEMGGAAGGGSATVSTMWSGSDLRDFARDVMPARTQAAALAPIDALIADRPPAPAGTCG